jgi:hypothetical protein
MMRCLRVAFLSALLSALPSAGLYAQTSYPFLHSLYPCGLQRGTTAEITLSGAHNYHGAYRVMIDGTGVTGEVIVPPNGWPPPDAKTGAIPAVNEIKLKVAAAPEAAPGVRELRVATPRGVSSVGLLAIDDEPEAVEKEPNNDIAQAQEVTLPVILNGRIQQGEDVDTFRFRAQAGEEVTFSVLCARLQDKIHDLQQHADPLITLRDATGREIDSSDDYYRADPLLHHKFEQAGDYYLQIRDVSYAGNPYWTYRLTITKRPFVTALLPLSAPPGASVEVQPVGYNLGAPPARLEVPAQMPMGAQYVQLKTANGLSNPVPVLITDLPTKTMPAAPPMDAPEPIPVPSVINARLRGPGEAHRYKFHAAKGQMFALEVQASRLDSPLDSVLTLLNARGQELASNDDIGVPDSRLEWTAPEEGDYLLDVRDRTGRGGDNFAYLLSVQPSGPDFTLRCDDDKMKLGPGNSGAWYIHVTRKFGFSGEIQVEVKGLPPGVTAAPLTIPANMGQGCLILTCAPDAKPDVSLVEVIGAATVNGPDGKPVTITRRAVPQSEIYIPGGGRGLYNVNTQAVAVTEPSDIVVNLSATNATLEPGGTARIDVTIRRKPGFTKPVSLDVYLRHLGSVYGNPLPPGVTLDEGASKTGLGENETQGHIVLRANPDAPPVTNLPIAILGQVSINFVVKISYSGPPVLLTVAPKK